MKLSQLLTAPNQLTLLRMVFVPFIVINLVAGHYKWALILFVLAGFSDGLDGLLARTLKQQTTLGQYLDPIADKLLLSTMFMVLAILHKIPGNIRCWYSAATSRFCAPVPCSTRSRACAISVPASLARPIPLRRWPRFFL